MSLEGKGGYSAAQIALHWTIAVLVLFQLVWGDSMSIALNAPKHGRVVSDADAALASAHYWVGIAILALVLARLAVRLSAGAPAPAAGSGPRWMAQAARGAHALFYALLIATPLLGLLGYYVGEPFDDIHSAAKPVFIVLIALHALAALFHQFWLRDGTLRRMLVPA
jgi:cytochrome b561